VSAPRLRARRVPGGFVVERPGLYVFDADLEQAREWAETLERAATSTACREGFEPPTVRFEVRKPLKK